MKDWKGNIIKSEDIIIVVRVKSQFKNPKLLIPKLDGHHQYVNLPEFPEHTWGVGEELLVNEYGGKLYVAYPKLLSGDTYNFSFDYFNFNEEENVILCIKGVSDSKDEYYSK